MKKNREIKDVDNQIKARRNKMTSELLWDKILPIRLKGKYYKISAQPTIQTQRIELLRESARAH